MNNNKKPRNAALESESSGAERRYGRVRDVEQMFSLGRTTIFNLIKSGRISSAAVSVTGKRSRARLIDLDSVREFVESQRTSERGQA
jgi:hypothetical protein